MYDGAHVQGLKVTPTPAPTLYGSDQAILNMHIHARLVAAAFAASTFALTSCGGGGSGSSGPPQAGTYVYVLNAGQATISAYVLNTSSGALTAVQGSPFATVTGGYSMAVQRQSRTLFVATTLVGSLSAMSVNSATGQLSAPAGQVFTGGGPVSTVIDSTGAYLYTANSVDGTVSAFKINASDLTEVPGSPFSVGRTPYAVAVRADSKFVFVANRDDGSISVLSVDPATGALQAVPGSPFALTGTFRLPVALAVNPAGSLLFATTGQDIAAFSVDAATGALSQVFSGAGAGGDINSMVVDPTGKYLYLAAAFAVYGYSIDSQTGGLQSLASGPYTNSARSLQVALDPSGKFLLVTDNSQNTVASYAVNSADGSLTAAPGSPFPLNPASTMGQGPTQVVALN